eukprot:3440230-Prorocentrum_lima.AAC.1
MNDVLLLVHQLQITPKWTFYGLPISAERLHMLRSIVRGLRLHHRQDAATDINILVGRNLLPQE